MDQALSPNFSGPVGLKVIWFNGHMVWLVGPSFSAQRMYAHEYAQGREPRNEAKGRLHKTYIVHALNTHAGRVIDQK